MEPQADWDLNAELDDKQAEARGLDNLCWEEEDDSWLLAESDRPSSLEEALERLAALQAAISKVASIEGKGR